MVMRQQRSQTRTMRAPSLVLRESHYPTPVSAGQRVGVAAAGLIGKLETQWPFAAGEPSCLQRPDSRQRGEEVLWPHSHPTHRPPASASHWVNLTGGQMSQEPCTHSLQGWAPRQQRRGKALSRKQGLQAWASIGTIISMYT